MGASLSFEKSLNRVLPKETWQLLLKKLEPEWDTNL